MIKSQQNRNKNPRKTKFKQSQLTITKNKRANRQVPLKNVVKYNRNKKIRNCKIVRDAKETLLLIELKNI